MSKENVIKQELQCEIVQDILPLYHDGVVSKVTHKAVSEHLEGCEACAKEYEYLCEELPHGMGSNDDMSITKSKFEKMKKKLKKKHVVAIALLSLFICTVLIMVLVKVPLVPIDDDTILVRAVYRIQTEEGAELFIAYNGLSFHGSMHWESEELTEPEENIKGESIAISLNMKRIILSPESHDIAPSLDIIPIDENVKTVYFGGDLIWSEEANGEDEVPDYVYNYAGVGFTSDTLIVGPNSIELSHGDGTTTRWDYNGNIIYEGEGGNIINK